MLSAAGHYSGGLLTIALIATLDHADSERLIHLRFSLLYPDLVSGAVGVDGIDIFKSDDNDDRLNLELIEDFISEYVQS